jgi:GDP-L-fucose synthase
MPDGTPRKLLDVTKISELGWRPKITICDGLKSTYDWYLKEYFDKP